ncbi:arylesterase [Methylococcaceae bacterium CS1]|nr:arylesterase [Methylococcaceae bacterium CS4]TXK94718.1 arylesterase [Methylococcaceae bacterium CS5]TXL03674.1 arylesterase [Methylococcaceae bacterium CS1]TXL03702.1 arylesterase [Methylococcaceae bacterium CS3]TXL07120.1 arylesterase [Methylococcaceae bacterium CS2]
MKKTFLFCIFIFLTACEQATAPVFEKLHQDAVILAFGDSLTYGTGAPRESDYPSRLTELSQHKVINAGIPGEINSTGLKRLPVVLDKYQPELLILIHGGNDMLRRIPEEQLASNLRQMIDVARQRNVKVVMLGVPKPRLFLLDSAAIYQQIAEEQQVPIDLEALPTILGDNALKSDTIHPNSDGYRLMAESIHHLLVATGAL